MYNPDGGFHGHHYHHHVPIHIRRRRIPIIGYWAAWGVARFILGVHIDFEVFLDERVYW